MEPHLVAQRQFRGGRPHFLVTTTAMPARRETVWRFFFTLGPVRAETVFLSPEGEPVLLVV
ncbi:MAG TPA: hypothetical protein VJJ80_03435 [Patescibacteria group bacterium]|nr:hypothetical protein [Patescibacteria group bacterium]